MSTEVKLMRSSYTNNPAAYFQALSETLLSLVTAHKLDPNYNDDTEVSIALLARHIRKELEEAVK